MYPTKPTGDNVVSENYIFALNNILKSPMSSDELLEGYNNKGESETELTSIPDASKFNSFLYQMHNTLVWVIGYITELYNAKVEKSGSTMTGTLAMGSNKVTTTYVPVNNEDATNKLYVDTAIAGNIWLGEIKTLSYPSIPTLPAGMEIIPCDGRELSRSTYSAYFSLVGTTYGVGNNSTTFNAPDLRGLTVRGWDNGRGLDPTRVFGTYQEDTLKSHRHLNGVSNDATYGPFPYGGTTTDMPGQATTQFGDAAGAMNAQGYTAYTGDTETRMKNIAMYHVVRVK